MYLNVNHTNIYYQFLISQLYMIFEDMCLCLSRNQICFVFINIVSSNAQLRIFMNIQTHWVLYVIPKCVQDRLF